jgi:hypothetical protein
MAALPPLPYREENLPWSSNVNNAYQILTDMYRHANHVLLQDDSDIPRIKYHKETLTNDSIPILLALEASAEEEGLPTTWLHLCAESLGSLIVKLCSAEETADGM